MSLSVDLAAEANSKISKSGKGSKKIAAEPPFLGIAAPFCSSVGSSVDSGGRA